MDDALKNLQLRVRRTGRMEGGIESGCNTHVVVVERVTNLNTTQESCWRAKKKSWK
jgi:hypothetical protein